MKQIFINLPVTDIDASMHFYEQMGFEVNPVFTDESQKCMVWSDHIYVMLQTNDMFTSYLKKPLPDLIQTNASSYTLPIETLTQLNDMMERGITAGGKEQKELLDTGFMQLRTIADLDGHIWGLICLDMEKFKQMKSQ